ncbi:5392_t:CDS:2 [Racocetra fulgida]|uniref:5392_t:CDS:1 n=1 Tax=Racocetra fulgida TaxID=60492 RepID=A0A9N8VHG8_9GLOM|nr:5392_t:CDS:2 [Racocetra fulgida]
MSVGTFVDPTMPDDHNCYTMYPGDVIKINKVNPVEIKETPKKRIF